MSFLSWEGLWSLGRGQGHGGGHARVWSRSYLLTCKKYFSILTPVVLHQCRHLNFRPGICPVALGNLKETTVVDQLRVV